MSEHGSALGAPSDLGPDGVSINDDDGRARWGLLARIGIAVGGLAAGLVVVFALLIVAVSGLRARSLEARHSEQVIATANGVQTLVIDFETTFYFHREGAGIGTLRVLDFLGDRGKLFVARVQPQPQSQSDAENFECRLMRRHPRAKRIVVPVE